MGLILKTNVKLWFSNMFPHFLVILEDLTFHFGISCISVSHLDPVLLVVLVVDGHVGQGGAHGVSRAVAVRGVVHEVHLQSRVRLRKSKRAAISGVTWVRTFTSKAADGIKANDVPLVGHFVFRHAVSSPSPQNVNRHFACENPAVIYTPWRGAGASCYSFLSKNSRSDTTTGKLWSCHSTAAAPQQVQHLCFTSAQPWPRLTLLLQGPTSSFNQPTRELCQISKQADYQSDYAQASGYISSNHIFLWSNVGTGHPSVQSSPHNQWLHPTACSRFFCPWTSASLHPPCWHINMMA